MTKDELIERVAKVISARSDLGMAYHRNRARAVVALMMPPPLVWRAGEAENSLITDEPFRGYWIIPGRVSFVLYGRAINRAVHPTLEAAQAAAQAHADAAWIAKTSAAQEAEK